MPLVSLSRLVLRAAAATLLILSGLARAQDAAPTQEQAEVQALRWFEAGRPAQQAAQAVELLLAAPSHGLDAEDYQAVALAAAVERAGKDDPLAEPEARALDAALTEAVRHYLSDLHLGRVDPAAVHQNFNGGQPADFQLPTLLDEALARRRLPELAQALAPQLPAYEQLRDVLAHYRTFVDHPAWVQPLPPLPGARGGRGGKLVAGQTWSGVDPLASRLTVLGDLEPGAAVPLFYIEPLVGAVRRFQTRHGLPADGVLGKATIAQLEVTPAARIRQIELGLERARWTPLLQAERMILINIPEFVLRAYEVRDGRVEIRERMKVIVGKALDTRTPLFDEDLRYIEFSPYWNVPPSIARAELVPKLRRQPGYWQKEGFEFVMADGRVQTALSRAGLDAVMAGQARIRQRPGEHNALGDIKFVFPNADNIYLHHTPSVGLFNRERRDFSHGCIRVEQPLALARFVLQQMPEWTEARIIEAMTAGKSATLKIDEPIPVVIAYGTALVKQGHIHFFDDLYGHDRLLDLALRQRPARQPPIREQRRDPLTESAP